MPEAITTSQSGSALISFNRRSPSLQDETYPEAEFDLPRDKTIVRTRTEGYSRHELLGLNVTLLEMFRQFWDVLGVRRKTT